MLRLEAERWDNVREKRRCLRVLVHKAYSTLKQSGLVGNDCFFQSPSLALEVHQATIRELWETEKQWKQANKMKQTALQHCRFLRQLQKNKIQVTWRQWWQKGSGYKNKSPETQADIRKHEFTKHHLVMLCCYCLLEKCSKPLKPFSVVVSFAPQQADGGNRCRPPHQNKDRRCLWSCSLFFFC